MHRDFRRLLRQAEGEGDFVIVVNVDIRGFSDWSLEVESIQAASYLAKLYPALIDTWFSQKWFFKPTGDGLLLIRPFKEKELSALAEETLGNCLEIVDEFGSLCLGEPMLNFPLPSDVGIGIAQGAASRLVAKKKVLDYSGAILNRASRLMDIARPRGIVFDAGFASGLLPNRLLSRFETAEVYLRGVSPKDPLDVFYLEGDTEIPQPNLSPIGELVWGKPITLEMTLRDLETPATSWQAYDFPERLSDPSHIKCLVQHPAMDGKGRRIKDGGWTQDDWSNTRSVRYEEEAGVPEYNINIHAIASHLREAGVKGPWPISIKVQYPI